MRFYCPQLCHLARCTHAAASCQWRTDKHGLSRSNSWLIKAFEKYPAEAWVYEVLEELPPGCSESTLRHAEQRHIEQLQSWDQTHGFNVHPATWFGNALGVFAARAPRTEQARAQKQRR